MNHRLLSIDLETYSDVDLSTCGVYRYVEGDFHILLFAYAFDDEDVQIVDIACGEQLPQEVKDAIFDDSIIKAAWNAQFERTCLSQYFGIRLSPDSWQCSMVWAASLSLPLKLKTAAEVLKTGEQKDDVGERLIKYFSVPCKPTKTNGGRTRNLPEHAPEDWEKFKAYCKQDVRTERDIRRKLEAFPLMPQEWDYGNGRVARALLSDRYRRIDNMEIATAVLPLFAGQDGMEVMSCEVTENRLYLKIVNHRLEMACVGDRVQAGVVISNSEVGLGAVSVQPLVYTLACTNGMVVSSLGERRAHVGRAAKAMEDSFYLYSDETMEAEDKAFLLKLRDTTLAAIEEARFAQIVGKLEEAAGAKITGRVQDVIELTGKAYDLNQPEQDNILNYLIQGGDLSLYGLSNAITRASQDVESYDRATALEGIGWQVATMEPAQWKEINA